jgi:hypothetical protein
VNARSMWIECVFSTATQMDYGGCEPTTSYVGGGEQCVMCRSCWLQRVSLFRSTRARRVRTALCAAVECAEGAEVMSTEPSSRECMCMRVCMACACVHTFARAVARVQEAWRVCAMWRRVCACVDKPTVCLRCVRVCASDLRTTTDAREVPECAHS